MTSTIDAQIKIETSFEQIIRNLFPCGSITGAPKLKTMELIHEIEQNPRGIYTGAIGYILPNNDMQFNVAIRTLSKHINENNLKIGVGGGITVNSTALDEWHEIYTKLKFVRKFYTPNFKLIESLLFSNGKFNNLHEHLQRLAHSSQKLLFAYDMTAISKRLDELSLQLDTQLHYKVRIELDYLGTCAVDFAVITLHPKELKVAICNQMIDTTHELFKHKTTSSLVRGLYEQLYQDHKPDNIDELLFINQAGFITESRFYNIIIVINQQWITPPVSDGLLAGVYRQQLIQRGKLTEKQITKQDILTADAIYLCNDVRGLISCTLESNEQCY
jgi:para-aminobenzoate synthetase/4-amino-4-deoxychorismate lyase